ncbi:phosphoenolpyruvate phosphomutase-domain-containing protein [Flagelloscypha sp. PMI_526]|nr:phosphoenolpyruvate phosphomutase-domain-containing protein [Flagelloscypha sp. PMI_526]
MTANLESQAALFRSLHQPGNPVILCNIHDITTLSLVAQHPSVKALATASYAVAASNGTEDDALTLEENLSALTSIALEASKKYPHLPLSADIQEGYGDRLEEVIEKLLDLGIVGCNLEDLDRATQDLYPLDVACERIRRVMRVAESKGVPSFVVNARTDTLPQGGSLADAIARGQAYLAAGATTTFVWGGGKRGGMSKAEAEQVCEAVGGKLSVMRSFPNGLNSAELTKVGVSRISVGPTLYIKALAAYKQAINDVLT